MSSRRFALLLAALCITCTCLACGGDPPDREIQQAEEAIASAQSAGADRFAAEEYKAAQDALARSRDAVTARDYRLALNHALDARERALAAASQATTTLAAARSAADMAIGVATRGVATTNAAIQAAEASRAPARSIAALKAAVADAEAQLQEARTAWRDKDYPTATTLAASASEKLSGLSAELDTVSSAARRRR
jgi:hypothetical protein